MSIDDLIECRIASPEPINLQDEVIRGWRKLYQTGGVSQSSDLKKIGPVIVGERESRSERYVQKEIPVVLRANQLRLWLSSMAYVLISALRRIALATTRFADATSGTIRLKLFKIGAQVRISVRRIKFSMASAFPYTDVFRTAWAALDSAAL